MTACADMTETKPVIEKEKVKNEVVATHPLTLAIITARGGSKRLPRKNVHDFCGLPLIAWAIIQATCADNVDGVYVSTDDDEIEEIAKKFGATVIRRPYWEDADLASAKRPALHALRELQNIYGDELKRILVMQPTQPLNKPSDFDTGFEAFEYYGCDCIGPLIPSRETIIYKKLNDCRARYTIFDKQYRYLTRGANWFITTPNYFINDCRTSDPALLDSNLDMSEYWAVTEKNYVPMECWQFVDTDTEEEFRLAEILFNAYVLQGKGPEVYFSYMKPNKEMIIPGATINSTAKETKNDAPKEYDIDALLKKYGGNTVQLNSGYNYYDEVM